MKVTVMDDRYNNNIRTEDLTWADVIDIIEHPSIDAEKGKGGAIIGGKCKYETGEDGKKHRTPLNRCMAILDADNVLFYGSDLFDFFSSFCSGYSCNFGLYDSFSSTPDKIKARIIVPLDRTVNKEEYELITTALMYEIPGGFGSFDICSRRWNQIMFLPSINANGAGRYQPEYIDDGEPLRVDEYLDYIRGYITTETLETALAEATGRDIRPQYIPRDTDTPAEYLSDGKEDPRAKNSIVGTFCRLWNIEEAIEEFIPDVYTRAGWNKYKYAPSHSPAGLFIKSEGQYAYSMHTTDPVNQHGDVNAYDLVMIHKFGSDFRAMYNWVLTLPGVAELEKERHKQWGARQNIA